ncbi:hypothetical protein AGMMS49525_10020 [Bacteroidia bacterium]|nr:hypothetical protein AGMMS49525_10020 [Bacteroidia bacterium]
MFGEVRKDSLLKNVKTPRVIFVGDSNVSFGLNGQIIKDSLGIYPINTTIHFSIGLQYMFKHTLPYIKSGDVVILPLIYGFYLDTYDKTSEELFRMVMDVDKNNLKYLNKEQILHLIPYIPKYALTKFDPFEYVGFINNKWYEVTSFNEFGDVTAHWNEGNQYVAPMPPMSGSINPAVINGIKEFEQEVVKKGGSVFLSYPCPQDATFRNSVDIINAIQQALEANFNVLGTPQRYIMPDSLLFNAPYHLNKKGADRRTKLLIEDWKLVKR